MRFQEVLLYFTRYIPLIKIIKKSYINILQVALFPACDQLRFHFFGIKQYDTIYSGFKRKSFCDTKFNCKEFGINAKEKC